MRTNASYYLDGATKGDVCVFFSADGKTANIEFRGGELPRQHYIIIHGLTPDCCRALSYALLRAARELRP